MAKGFLKRFFDHLAGRAETRDDSPIIVHVAEIFGDYPGERGAEDETMMKGALTEALERAQRYDTYVVLNLDNVRGGYSSRFLYNVFAGFGGPGFYEAQCCGPTPKLLFKSNQDPSLVLEITGYLKRKPAQTDPVLEKLAC